MNMTYDAISRKGIGLLNEDAVITLPKANVYGVLDGVSSLVPYLNSNNETGGFIASNLIKEYFQSITEIGSLKDHLILVNDLLREQMELANIDLEKKEELWGSALAIVHIQDNGVEFIQTGDCMILAVYDNEEVRPLTWQQVSHLEAPAFSKWQEGINKGLKSRKELHETVIDIIRKNRYQSNTDGGYGVLNGEKNAVRFFEYGKINLTGIKHIILMTDGLFLPMNIVPEQSSYWSFVAHRMLDRGIKLYTEELIELEESDPECMEYIRFKKSDDKTAIVISF
ncbi:protein phosphatase 2C domain-containing protein [Paenibacillus glycanilyticus]|uniref:protein phosphatase 2C domain-containing protein n=1 Tax=Paenibacillus glycanilyticus TaxID=126569 RepID=UPI0020404819|nr:protein phosphatase 2C domain-containing protein [Paenibacillus glycanilyticus]MCM3628475.1 protein phosphatase 2C domain-containing protein [Paenibacillus glycanilyticus]